MFKKSFVTIIPFLISTTLFSSPHCNYKTTEHAKYIKQQYQYKPGNINDSCVDVYTITDYLKGSSKNKIVEIPTSSSWVFTENNECRCIDLKQPESLWNKTFPQNHYTTKDILITLKSYATVEEPENIDSTLFLTSLKENNSISSKDIYKDNLLIQNNNTYVTKVDNNIKDVDQELLKMKRMNNNIFITNDSNYIKEIKLKRGKYMISFYTTPDINIIQIFNSNLVKIKEFRMYQPYETQTNFFIDVENKLETISFMGLNPYGKGNKKGIFDIKINNIK